MKKLNLKNLQVKSFVTSLKEKGQGTKEIEGGTVIYTPACPATTICPETNLCPIVTHICPINTLVCPIQTIDCSFDCSLAGCPTDAIC